MDLPSAALAQALAVYAQNQRDFTQAEQWYRKSLAIKEKLGNEHGAAGTYGRPSPAAMAASPARRKAERGAARPGQAA
jgi:hypothetical protein